MKGHAPIRGNHGDARARLTPAGWLELDAVTTARHRLKSTVAILSLASVCGSAVTGHWRDFHGPVSRRTRGRANLNDHQRISEGRNRPETKKGRKGDTQLSSHEVVGRAVGKRR